MTERAAGRPRSEDARQAILDAATTLLTTGGPKALRMDAIARKARVAKQTVYRWWSSPAEILLEALNEGAERAAPLKQTSDVASDVREFAHRSVAAAREARGPLTVLMAEAQRSADFGETFRADFLARRRSVLRELLVRVAFDPPIDPDFAAEQFYAAIWYRLLADTGPLDAVFADRLANGLLRNGQSPLNSQ